MENQSAGEEVAGVRDLISFTKKAVIGILEEIKILKLQLKGIITESAMSYNMLGFNKKFSDDQEIKNYANYQRME